MNVPMHAVELILEFIVFVVAVVPKPLYFNLSLILLNKSYDNNEIDDSESKKKVVLFYQWRCF